MVPRLASNHYKLIVPDIRGYGESSKPPSIEAYAKSVMEKLGHDSFFICAHDRGARIAHKMLVDYPDRARRAILLDVCPTLCRLFAFETRRGKKSPQRQHKAPLNNGERLCPVRPPSAQLRIIYGVCACIRPETRLATRQIPQLPRHDQLTNPTIPSCPHFASTTSIISHPSLPSLPPSPKSDIGPTSPSTPRPPQPCPPSHKQ